MFEYQETTVEYDPELSLVFVPDQPDGSILLAYNTETLGGLLMYPEGVEVVGVVLTREEALPIFVSLMGREPEPGEMP